jgi:hypothetical protein
MPKNNSSAKRVQTQLPFHRQLFSEMLGEDTISDLISVGSLLPKVLNELCTSLDFQIGDIVSAILPAGHAEDDFGTLKKSAQQFGLHVFWSARICSAGGNHLGTLQMFSCDMREPTVDELHLIRQVMVLAALALQRHEGEFTSVAGDEIGVLRRPTRDVSRLN